MRSGSVSRGRLAILCVAMLVIVSACGSKNASAPSVTTDADRENTQEPLRPTELPIPTATIDPASIGVGIPTPMPPQTLDPDGDGWMTTEEYTKALETMYPAFHFPPGYALDIDSITAELKTPEWKDHGFQINYPYTAIGLPQLCAWSMYWLDSYTTGRDTEAAEALQFLTDTIPTNPTFISMSADIESWVQSAALGDPAPLQSFVQYNCSDYFA